MRAPLARGTTDDIPLRLGSHSSVLQDSSSVSQLLLPHSLVLVLSPPPHGTLQLLHVDQGPIPLSVGGIE